MIYIKNVKLIGFKTFGILSSITFDKRFTCLIGPHNSGKSNIFNAIEFVLGPSNLDQKDNTYILYQGKKGKRIDNFIEISFSDEIEEKSETSFEFILSKSFKENEEESFKVNNKSINHLQFLNKFSLPKIEGITNINVLTKDKIHKLLRSFITNQGSFVQELVKNSNELFKVNISSFLPSSQITSIHNLVSVTYSELTGRITKKDLFNVDSFSEEERTILGISLIVTLAELFKFPFLLLDEIDSQLDPEVVHNLAVKLCVMTRLGIQVIVITHREIMMAEADLVWGVSAKNGLSQLWQLNIKESKEKQVPKQK